MAKNRLYATGNRLPMNVSALTGSGAAGICKAGDPVAFGAVGANAGFGGVCITDENATTGIATVQFDGVFNLAVKGKNAADADTAVGANAIVYWDDAVRQLNLDSTNGYRFGYALTAVTSGATATVPVRIGY